MPEQIQHPIKQLLVEVGNDAFSPLLADFL
jgi:hypothetical protein